MIEGLLYLELYFVFFLELKGNIKKNWYDFDRYGVNKYDYLYINGFLLDERFVGFYDRKIVRVISWVICYGYYKIL